MIYLSTCTCGTIPAFARTLEMLGLLISLKLVALAPISHLRPVRWGLFSILKISAVFEQEASYDD